MTAPDTGSSPEQEAGTIAPDLGATGEDADVDAPAMSSPDDPADSSIGTTGEDDYVEPPA